MNEDGLTRCLWHIADEQCYFYQPELEYNDGNWTFDDSDCVSMEKTDGSIWWNLDLIQLIILCVAVFIAMICILTLIVVFFVKKRKTVQVVIERDLCQGIEMPTIPLQEERNESAQNAEPGKRTSAAKQGSKTLNLYGEGMEAEEGNNTVMIHDGDV